MEIEGRIILDLPMQQGTSKAGNPWKKKEWVLETLTSQYPRKIKFHVFGDRADTMIFEVGKDYSISVDLESREFNGRWYTDVSAYSMRELGATRGPGDGYPPAPGMQTAPGGFAPAPAPAPAVGPAPAASPTFTSGGNDAEDLPF